MERAASFEFVWPLEFDPENPYRFPIPRTVWRVADENDWIIRPIGFSGFIDGSEVLGGTLSIGPAPLFLTGAVNGSGVLGGNFTYGYALTGGVSGVGSLGAALSLEWNLVGNVGGNGTLTGALSEQYNLVGDIAGTGTLAGTVSITTGQPSALLLAIRT